MISIVIPAYNEEETIVKTVSEILDYLKKTKLNSEIIVVDDGSSDKTSSEARKIKNNNVKIISYEKNRGKGYAVRKGVLSAKGGLILICDADLSTPIAELSKFLPCTKDYDIVIGSRALKESNIVIKQPFYKVWLGRLGNLMIRILAVKKINDTQCGFKLFSSRAKELFEMQTIERWGWDFEILFLAQRKGYKIKELPVTWKNREATRVKLSDYPKTLSELLKIRMNWIKGRYR